MRKPRLSASGIWLAFLVVGCGSSDSNTGGEPPASTDNTVQPSGPGLPSVGPTGQTGNPPAQSEQPPSMPVTTPVGPTGSSGPVPVSPTPNPSSSVTTPTPATSTPPGETEEPTAPVDTTTEPEVPIPVVLPQLVTSGQGAYWQEGQLTDAQGGATVTVNEAAERQEWLGFGGTFNEAGWDALSVIEAGERARAIQLLFDAQDGAHFAYGRIPIGASDFALERYTLNDTPNDTEMTNFSIERDKQYLIPYIKESLKVNQSLRLWASPWTPPAWMKTNNDFDGIRQSDQAEAKFRNDADTMKAFALYLALFVEKYAEEGLTIEAVHPQNEPGYATRYPSCLWDPPVLRDFIRDYLGPTFTQRNIASEIWLGTMSAPEDVAHVETVMADNDAKAYVKGIGLQWNTMGSVGTFSSSYGVPVIQTEHRCGNYPFNVPNTPAFNPDQPANDHAYGVESWWYIRDWLKAGVNSYSAWNMILDTKGHNSDYQRPWPQNALLTVDRNTKQLNVTPTYYVFRHVSQFVDAGAKRLDVSGSTEALAFKNPDGGIVTVLHNPGGQPQQVTLAAAGRTVQFSVPANGFATVNLEKQ